MTDEEQTRRWYGDGYSNDTEKAADMWRQNGALMGIILQISEAIKPHLSTRFVEGDPLADAIEQILSPSGVELRDTDRGPAVLDAQARLRRIAAWYVHYRNDEGNGYGDLEGFFTMLGMTQEQLTDAYFNDPRLSDFEASDRRTRGILAKQEEEYCATLDAKGESE